MDDENTVAAYHDIQFWPQWAACELGGAIRIDRQGAGAGVGGAATAFNWLFDVIGVDLICETAALDNHRTARLLEKLGFMFQGQIESALPGGGTRPSKCWEMTKEAWRTKQNC
jgi:RimJ/RimL family protein N-acetyltransferase